MDHRNSEREGGDGESKLYNDVTAKVAGASDLVVEQDEAKARR